MYVWVYVYMCVFVYDNDNDKEIIYLDTKTTHNTELNINNLQIFLLSYQ